MSENNKPDNSSTNVEDHQDKDLERLLKIAGEPPLPDAERKAMHKQALAGIWKNSVRQQRRMRWQKLLVPVGLAASLVLAVVVFVSNTTLPTAAPIAEIVYRLGDMGLTGVETRQDGALYAGDLLVTQKDGALTFSMSDASIVQLDASTELTLQGEGELWLHHGRVFVDSPGLQSSVVIHTAWGTLRDTGTAFEVSVNEQMLQVAMRDGVVELTLQDGGQPAVRAAVENGAGDVLTVDTNMALTRSSRPTSAAQWEWVRRGTPAFPQGSHSLNDVLIWAARQSGRQLAYVSPIVEMQAQTEIVNWPAIKATSIETQLKEFSQTIDYEVVFAAERIEVKPKR